MSISKRKERRRIKVEDTYNLEPETTEDILFRQQLAKEHRKYLDSLTPEQKRFIRFKLANRVWRMNSLYYIRDKYSKLSVLKFNKAQSIIDSIKHNRKIILKSRQQGVSTYYVEKNLDKAIFQSGFSAGIQSYGLDEANKLKMRAELMIEMFDKDILDLLNIRLIADNQKGMLFSNGSILKIGNFRGDTLQSLHISELAKIDKDRPDKSLELKTGAFQAVATNNEITIESTAEGQQGLFYDIWQRSYTKYQTGRRLTPMDFYPIFISWLEDPDCSYVAREDDYIEPTKESIEYEKELLEQTGKTLTQEQRNWLILKLEELGDDFNKEYPATPELAFKQTIEGTYLLKQYKKLIKEKRIGKYKYNGTADVYVSFDLGINDEMVLHFVALQDSKPYIINEYHNTGEGIAHYVSVIFKMIDTYGYKIKRVFMPHDINVRELGSGLTRLEVARSMGLNNILVLKRLPFKDSINAVRMFIDSAFINEDCENTILAIQNYRKKYNKALQIYMDEDIHDIHSNYIASLRYMAQGLTFKGIRKATKNNREINKQIIKKSSKVKRKKINLGFSVV